MATRSKSRKGKSKPRSRKFRLAVLGRPSGVIQPRVQQVGPEHFGVIAVDCAKDRSKWMLCDFYGKILVEPTIVEHQCSSLVAMTLLVRDAFERHNIKDSIACVEMTGTYHQIIFRHLKRSGYDTRIVHPFASSHYRLPEHGDLKTDDHDLAAIFRASINGFGLIQKEWDPVYRQLQIIARHRRDLVNKRSRLQCQIRHHLQRTLPGYANLFPKDDMWAHPLAVNVLRFIADHGGTHQAILDAGLPSLGGWLREQKCRFQGRTLDRIYSWAKQAVDGDELSSSLSRVWFELLDDWKQKMSQITAAEVDEAALLVQTPYILLLSHPGINVISAAELAGETGPIEHYASCKSITGRAGLFPSRYQSDETDRGGNLSRFRNGRMRAAWLLVAANMVKCNVYWRGKASRWKEQGHDGRDIRCRIANRLSRPIFQMVSGRKLYSHPSRLDRGYVLEKLMEFHRDRGTPPSQIVTDLRHAADQIPAIYHSAEATPLKAFHEKSKRSRRSEPKQLGSLLVAVLARLGCHDIESTPLEVPTADSDVGTH
jgi:transposase